jgi:hypothetical protein
MGNPLTALLQAGEGYHTEFKQGIDTGNGMRSRVQDILGQIEPRP